VLAEKKKKKGCCGVWFFGFPFLWRVDSFLSTISLVAVGVVVDFWEQGGREGVDGCCVGRGRGGTGAFWFVLLMFSGDVGRGERLKRAHRPFFFFFFRRRGGMPDRESLWRPAPTQSVEVFFVAGFAQ
jgi:hypothetical protein